MINNVILHNPHHCLLFYFQLKHFIKICLDKHLIWEYAGASQMCVSPHPCKTYQKVNTLFFLYHQKKKKDAVLFSYNLPISDMHAHYTLSGPIKLITLAFFVLHHLCTNNKHEENKRIEECSHILAPILSVSKL